MNTLTRHLLRLLPVAALLLGACSSPAERTVALIPNPQSLSVGSGYFKLQPQVRIIIEDQALLEMQLKARLFEVIDPAAARVPGIGSDSLSSGPAVRLSLGGDAESLGSEGYRLSVSRTGVEITGADPVGVFYGIQTLRQLLPAPSSYASGSAWGLPYCEIFDSPRFPWRGQLLDVSRHFLPLEFVKKNIDYLAALKLNVFHWHLTDDQGWRVEIPAYPKLTSVGAWRVDRNEEEWFGRAEPAPGEEATYGGFYTRSEISDVIEYARLRGVTVVPEFDMPGHSRATIAAYPDLSCDGIQRGVATGGIMDTNTYCPGKELTFEFVEKLLASVIELFPSEYIHIGGDECNKDAWRVCADCQKRIEDEGLADVEELQSYFIERVEKMINARGRKMIGWDEILEGGLAPNAVVMSWRGVSGGITAAREGHEVIMTPGEFCYLDLRQGDPETEPKLGYSQLLLSTAYSYEPIPEELTTEQQKLILGIQGNLWGESIQVEENANYMLFPRLYAIAEVAWSQPERRGWKDFVKRLEPALERLTLRGIGYAPSMYQVAIAVDDDSNTQDVEVSLDTEHGDVEIRFTLDGSQPDSSSVLYASQLLVSETTEVRAAAFRGQQRLGRLSRRVVELHMAIGRPVQSATEWSPKYPAGGAAGLADGRRGSLMYADGRWVAFEGGDLDVTVDLGEVVPIQNVSLGCLSIQKSWIFFPSSVEVLLSTDGERFTQAGLLEFDAGGKLGGETRRDFSVSIPKAQARYVRVRAVNLGICPEWHPGAGGSCWLFADEIVIN